MQRHTFLSVGLGLAGALCALTESVGQCTNNNTAYSATPTSVACPGTVSVCVQGGQYLNLTVVAGNVYTMSTCGASWNTLITLFNGTGTTNLGFNDDACNNNRSALQWTATYSGTLRVLLDNNSCGTNGTCAPLVITCGFPDEPCTATTLSVNPTCVNSVYTNVGATTSPGITAPGCGGYSGGDVWARLTVPASGGVTVTASTIGGSSLTDAAMAIYAGATCSGTLTLLSCDDNSGAGNMPQLTVNCRTPGETLYIRVWENGNNAFGTFNLCAVATPTPANDLPCAATALTVGLACTTVQGTTIGATGSGVAVPTCANYLGRDVWYTLTVPSIGMVNITTGTVAGSALTDGGMAVYTASNCANPATFVQIACNDDAVPGVLMPALALTGLTPGATLYVRVWQRGNTTCGTFTICAVSPEGEDPCSAYPHTVTSTCSMTSYTNVGRTLTPGVDIPGCGNLTASSKDIWFRFTAPSTGVVIIQSTSGTLTDGAMALYRSATCTSGALILEECDDNDGFGSMPFLRLADLIPGATYYLRFWGYGSATGTFNLCIWSPPIPVLAPGSCLYLLELFDTGENGWGTSAVQIQIGAGPVVNYTVSAAQGFYNNVLLAMPTGSTLQLNYVATGANQAQNRYELRQVPGGYGVFMAGPSPPSGLVFTEFLDCVPPPAPIEDCRGGRTICGDQSFSNSTLNTGFDVDLTARNFGCLSTSERKGTWYHFSPSASGTVGFTITPAANNIDYDFAVWGPTPSVVCEPNGPPTRCNYSATTGATGLASSGTNPSEPSGGPKWSSLLPVVTGQVYSLYISNYTNNSTAFTLDWQLTNGASLNCDVLPIELIDLQATTIEDSIQISWSTASETNTNHFAVERSSDMVDFIPIGTVQASGSSIGSVSYNFMDTYPEQGINYYRIQEVDIHGNTTTSPTVHAIHRKATTQLVVFPNPAGDELYASFALNEDGAFLWRVIDATGRLLDQDLMQGTMGNMLVNIPLAHLPAGSYSLLINDAHGLLSMSARFIRY